MPPLVIPFPNIDPVLFEYGPLVIRWYALAYIFGILLGWVYARAIIRRPRLWGGPAPMTVVDFDDFILWITLGVIVGGRLGQVLFYDLAYYAEHPLEIVMLWHGGMSFHGGFLGCVIATILFAHVRNIPFLALADVCCGVVPIGLFLGRIANLINGELWGRPTDVPWAMVFPRAPDALPRHPSQLYEAGLEGIVLFVLLALLIRGGSLKRRGLTAGVFMIGYGVARIISEFFREPDPPLLGHGLTMGMVLSMPMILVGVIFIVYAYTHPPRSAEHGRDQSA